MRKYLLFLWWSLTTEPVGVRVYRRCLACDFANDFLLMTGHVSGRALWDKMVLYTVWTEQMTPLHREYARWQGLPEAVQP